MRLIDADALIKMMVAENNRHPGVSWEITDIERYVTKLLPTINLDDLRPQGRYRIDGHHIRFKCCDKVLSTVPNESDDYENLVSCPFCDAKMDGKEQGDDN